VTDRPYRLEFSAGAARHLRKIDKSIAARIRAATEQLRFEPRPQGAKALQGRRGYLRIRVGDHRVIYRVEDDRLLVLVLEIGHRREVYRNP
jgi:mRNA interferase RelE/StbE